MRRHIDKRTKPTVSIITAMYNVEAFILETIKSVVNQTYNSWELILIDDASTDTTLKTIQPFLEDSTKIKLIKNTKNLGTALTRNRGIETARGDFIAFLDGDDLWKPEKLEKQIKFMKNNQCLVSFSSYEQIDEIGNPLNTLIKALPKLTYNKFLKSNYIGNLTGMYNAKVLGKITTPDLRKRQDWLLWLKAVEKSGKPALGIQESLACYRVRKHSISSNKWQLLKYNYKVYKKGLEFSTLKSLYFTLIFLLEHFFVKSKRIISINKI